MWGRHVLSKVLEDTAGLGVGATLSASGPAETDAQVGFGVGGLPCLSRERFDSPSKP
jgi:hypothetical protein